MKPGFWGYVRAAFNARPLGMFVPPNWVGLAAFGLLGAMNPGFWVIGAGVELGYLALLATNPRFQRTVAGTHQSSRQQEWQGRLGDMLERLEEGDRRQYVALAARCQSILDQQRQGLELSPDLESQSDSLGRLAWTYLRLLLTRQSIRRMLTEAASDSDGHTSLEDRLRRLERQMEDPNLQEDLRRSLTGQVEILKQRIERRAEARNKLAFVEAELTRIRDQVELIREQAVVSTDPHTLSRRIDEIATTLGSTAQWIRDQQQIYGTLEDLVSEPPPLAAQARLKESA